MVLKRVDILTYVVFAHNLMNPPTEFRSNIASLTLKSPKQFLLTKEDENFETQYHLSVKNPPDLGLQSKNQSDVINFFSDIVLAFNLILDISALKIRGQDVRKYEWTYEDIKHGSAESPISENAARFALPFERGTQIEKVSPEEVKICLDDRTHVRVVISEDIDETDVINALSFVNNADRHSRHSNMPFKVGQKLNNIGKALLDYEHAMSAFDVRYIFRDLYSALQLATNCDQNPELEGQILDAEITRLTNVPKKDAKEWRDFYNRLKHIDEEPTKLAKYEQGMEKLPHLIDPIRRASKKVMIHRLKSL